MQPPRERLLFDQDWKFLLDDPAGAEAPAFDAAAWRTLDLPHDWSIEGKMDPQAVEDGSGGYRDGGVAWYRRSFTVPASWSGKRVGVEFEGVYMNATVYINGENLGMHPYGYTTFFHDLTPHLKPGPNNVLAVRVDQTKRNSRWYSGAGIYRHVWLNVTGPVSRGAVGSLRHHTGSERRPRQGLREDQNRQRFRRPSNVALHTVLYGPSGAAAGRSDANATVRPGPIGRGESGDRP